jgi:hypothetical protein
MAEIRSCDFIFPGHRRGQGAWPNSLVAALLRFTDSARPSAIGSAKKLRIPVSFRNKRSRAQPGTRSSSPTGSWMPGPAIAHLAARAMCDLRWRQCWPQTLAPARPRRSLPSPTRPRQRGEPMPSGLCQAFTALIAGNLFGILVRRRHQLWDLPDPFAALMHAKIPHRARSTRRSLVVLSPCAEHCLN